jgi:DNA modification methylase
VQSNWKPLIVYGGGPLSPRFSDVFRSVADSGKGRHEWGQNYEAFCQIIEAMTMPEARIADPFAGGGTTLFAAKALGRHAIGSEVKREVFEKLDGVLNAAA